MIKRCPKCTGKKTIMGLGCIIHKCPECKGVGHVKVENVETKNIETVQIDFPLLPRLDENKPLKIVDKKGDEICSLAPVTKIDRHKKEFRQVRS